ncbi:MAG: ABC transporter permease [Defluviitaleaceae bacterium]|nr:ABC transporter permease [Defluviitaleaceae bacterium]
MISRFFSQSWLYAKAANAGLGLTEFFAYRAGISITTLILYVLIARYTQGDVDLTRWVMGNAFALCVYECIFGMGGYFNAERFNGRLRSIIASPTSKLVVIMSSSVPSVIIAFLTVTGAFLIGGLIFGVPFANLNIPMFAISITTAAFACVGLGLLFGAFALLTDSMYLILNALATLIMIFSGANFPVSQLPIFAQYIANAFPLFRSVAAGNLAMGGSFTPEFARLILGEAALGAIYFAAALALIKIIERTAIKKATLEMF